MEAINAKIQCRRPVAARKTMAPIIRAVIALRRIRETSAGLLRMNQRMAKYIASTMARIRMMRSNKENYPFLI